jgi:LemA protein
MIEFAFLGCVGFFVVVCAILVLFYLVSIYNGLVTLRNNIDKAWANIDVLLKQRFDMIPNLVETVKGYAKYEKGVLEEVTKLRAALVSAGSPGAKAKVNDALTTSLKSIFAVAENYPKLQANENFLKLQEQLAAMENQIADRREFYNDSVLLYNTRIASLPDSIFAGMMGMTPKEYFKAEEGEKGVVQVKLDDEKK